MPSPRPLSALAVQVLLALTALSGTSAQAARLMPDPNDLHADEAVSPAAALVLLAQATTPAGSSSAVAATAATAPAATAPAATAPAATAPDATAPAAPSAMTVPTISKPAAAGTFDIDEDAAQRALERTLTQSGALLLPPGTFEITPGLQFARIEQTSPILLSFTSPQTGLPTTAIAESRVRRNEFTARADVRYGLPFNAQAEFSLPYTRITAQQNNTFDAVNSASANRLGDITLGIAKTFAREKGAMPDVIGRVTWTTGSGKPLAPPLSSGGGFRQLQGEIVAVKRQDPLAFVASFSYAHVFEKDGVRPGGAAILSLSALLAASPATSLQLGFAQVLRAKQEINGVRQDGTDQTYGVITLGASSVLSRDVTLVTQFGIGLGNDAPRYTISIAFPIVFR